MESKKLVICLQCGGSRVYSFDGETIVLCPGCKGEGIREAPRVMKQKDVDLGDFDFTIIPF